MPRRIGPRKPARLYLVEWREKYALTQELLAARLGTSHVTISRWETGKRKPDNDALQAIAEALNPDMDWHALYRHPGRPTADDLLRDQPPEVVEQALRLIKAIRR